MIKAPINYYGECKSINIFYDYYYPLKSVEDFCNVCMVFEYDGVLYLLDEEMVDPDIFPNNKNDGCDYSMRRIYRLKLQDDGTYQRTLLATYRTLAKVLTEWKVDGVPLESMFGMDNMRVIEMYSREYREENTLNFKEYAERYKRNNEPNDKKTKKHKKKWWEKLR
ncbi:MAG: hypothetical protein LUC31_03045 [Coprobacillus sp.]|nr:hypothetical protein [Coprobacillus sp.]